MPQTNRLVPGTHQQWRTWSRCCILQLSWTRPAVHSRCVPNLDGLVQGKHHVLWCWCLQPVHWGLEHVSSDQHGSVELMPQTNRLVPGTHQQWRTWSRCCILQLSWTRPAVHSRCVPNLDGLVQGKHHVLRCWCLQPVHWGLEHVSSDQHGSVELMPQTNRLVPGTHQQWRTWSRCCILQLSWTRPAVHSRCVPNLDGLVQGKHLFLWCGCLQPVHWGLEHVSSDQHGGMFHGATATTHQIGAWNASAVTGAVVEQYTAFFVYNVWKQSYLAYNTCPPFYIYLLYMIYYCSIQAQSTDLPTPRAMVCCLKLLSATFGNAEVFHAPMGWWKASTMFFGADAFSQSIGAWNMSAVTNIVPWS